MDNGSLNIVVLGKTGYGKSCTANTVLGRDVFEKSRNTHVGTLIPGHHSDRYKDLTLNVFDMPGAFDTRFNNNIKRSHLKTLKQNQLVMEESENIDAFLFVLNFSCRWTNEDTETVKLMRRIFGNEFFIKHCILVITHWDEAVRKGVKSLKEWLPDQHESLKQLVFECQDRCVVFDNTLTNREERDAYREALLEIAIKMPNQNSKYTLADFKRNYMEHVKLQISGSSCAIL